MRNLATTALAAALLVAGCSGGGSENDADVAFVQGMAPHHEQAVEMADLVDDATGVSPELTALAARIEDAQEPEIDQMEEWLDDWDVADSDDHASMEGMDHGSMSGMMSSGDLTALAELDGPAFEQRWLTMMIEHHRGAVEAAETVVADGSDPDVRALAEQIVASQSAEISEMEGLLS